MPAAANAGEPDLPILYVAKNADYVWPGNKWA
jgi:hypothetical protein